MLKELTQKEMEKINGGDTTYYHLGDYLLQYNSETREVNIFSKETGTLVFIINLCEPCTTTSTTATTSSGPTGPTGPTSGSSYSGPDYSNPSSPPYAV